jgi:hypothetical protein
MRGKPSPCAANAQEFGRFKAFGDQCFRGFRRIAMPRDILTTTQPVDKRLHPDRG